MPRFRLTYEVNGERFRADMEAPTEAAAKAAVAQRQAAQQSGQRSLSRLDTLAPHQPVQPDLSTGGFQVEAPGRSRIDFREERGLDLSPGSFGNIQDFRPATIMAFEGAGEVAGAVAGGTAGLGTGPLAPIAAPAGAFAVSRAGAAGGAAFGSLAFDAATDIMRRFGIVGPEGPFSDGPTPPPLSEHFVDVPAALEPSARALEEAGQAVAAPVVLKAGFNALRRGSQFVANVASPSSQYLIDATKRLSAFFGGEAIPVGIETASENRGIQLLRKLFGSFPGVFPGAKEADIRVGAALEQSVDQMFHDVAPVVNTIADTGVDLTKKFGKRFKAVRRLFNNSYEKLFAGAEEAGVIIEPKNLRLAAQGVTDNLTANLPRVIETPKVARAAVGFERAAAKGPEALAKVARDLGLEDEQLVLKFIERGLTRLAPMKPRQYQTLSRVINEMMAKNADSKPALQQLTYMKDAMRLDVEEAGGAFGEGFKAINAKFRDWSILQEGATATAFNRAKLGVFEAAKLETRRGTQNADQMFTTFFNNESPQALEELSQLVGQKAFRKALRTHMENSFNDATAETLKEVASGGFSLPKLERAFGISSDLGLKRQAMKRALELADTGVRIEDLDAFFTVAKKQFGLGGIDPGLLLKRRVALGGLSSGVKTLLPGAALRGAAKAGVGAGAQSVTGIPTIMTAVLGMRKFSRWLTTPPALKAATKALDDSLNPSERVKWFTRFIRLTGNEVIRPGDMLPQFLGATAGMAADVVQAAPGALDTAVEFGQEKSAQFQQLISPPRRQQQQ